MSSTNHRHHVNRGDDRGKRTLYDFGDRFKLYEDVAARRTDYASASYYVQDDYYKRNDATAQFSNQFGSPYASYPQYLEAPEPIIEIIIKDSNDTLPTEPTPPIITKKRKEKVHVYYVNYKKDKNNKLHLETPIASLNNDHDNEEEDEVIDYPPVTAAPQLKTTTLRTIIHPDSEKYHSNSGIHVTFGTADKSQISHIFEEHNAESSQHTVIALPNDPKPTEYLANTRADFGHHELFDRSLQQHYNHHHQPKQQPPQQQQPPRQQQSPQPQQPPQQQQPHQQPPKQQHNTAAYNYYENQQLPAQHSSTYFRPQNGVFQQEKPQQQQQKQDYQIHQFQKPYYQQQPTQKDQQYQPQQKSQQQDQKQPQRPNNNQQSTAPLIQPLQGNIPFLQELQHHAKYFAEQNQHYDHKPTLQQQQQKEHQKEHHRHQAPQPKESQSIFDAAQKSEQSIWQRQQHQKEQQIVFPTSPPKQQESFTHSLQTPYKPIKFRPTLASLQPIKSDQQYKQNYRPQSHQKIQQKPLEFHRQPEYIQTPTFKVPSPPTGSDYFNFATRQQITAHHINYNQHTGRPQNTQSNQQHHTQNELKHLHNYFVGQTSQSTELLKSIPKFEQHITETVQYNNNNNQALSSSHYNNQAIHDIPAPNLGGTQQSPPTVQVNFNSIPNEENYQITGHYITAASLSPSQPSYITSTRSPQYAQTQKDEKVMIVTPMPDTSTQYANQNTTTGAISSSQQDLQEPRKTKVDIKASSQYSVSNYHADVFKQLENQQQNIMPVAHQASYNKSWIENTTTRKLTSPLALQQLPNEVPDYLRQQLLSSGILNNADISILDYDKVGAINLENLPQEHLKHFFGAGGGAQISESNRVVSVVKPNGEKVNSNAMDINRVKLSNNLPQKQQLNVKVVSCDKKHEETMNNQYVEPNASIVPTVEFQTDTKRQNYNRYLPLKINGAQFPIAAIEELRGKKIVSVVVLAPVEEKKRYFSSVEKRAEVGTAAEETREIQFLGGDLIKALIKKPTTDNFKRWMEKEAGTDVESQSIVLLVAKVLENSEQEIFMYDVVTGMVNELNGELSSAFVSVAEENATAEDLEHGSTLNQSDLEKMMYHR